MRFLHFVLIGKKVLNPDSQSPSIAHGVGTGSAVSQSFGNINIAEHNSLPKFYFQIAFQQHVLKAVVDLFSALHHLAFYPN